MKIVTGYKGTPHITATQDRMTNRGIIGTGKYVLSGANDLTASIISNSEIRIYGGTISINGCIAVIEGGSYESVPIETGTQGKYRIDTIYAYYQKDATTGVENVSIQVKKGEEADTLEEALPMNADSGTVDDNNSAEMSLYHVTLSGINITGLDRAKSVEQPLNKKMDIGSNLFANPVNFLSGDTQEEPSEPASVGLLTSNSTLQTLMARISGAVHNVRYILAKLGSVELPTTASTITGAIAKHEEDISTINDNLSATSFNLTRNTANVSSGSGKGIYDKASKTVRIYLQWNNTDNVSSNATLFTIPSAYRPSSAVTGYGIVRTSGDVPLPATYSVSTAGEVAQTASNAARGGFSMIEYILG